MMQMIADVAGIRSWRQSLDPARQIALVPTMGALHQGHLSLVKLARSQADQVVMSVFVNPLQFRPGEDFERYPRDLDRDAQLAAEAGVDCLFVPSVEEMYAPGREILITASGLASRWEGAARPGHFNGVLTVVAKLFHLVQPDWAVFGQKDIQQVTLIRRMVQELNFPLSLLVAPTLRSSDGLALSSRNAYLNQEEREAAPAIRRGLLAAVELWQSGERQSRALERAVERQLEPVPLLTPEYIAITDPVELLPVEVASTGTILAIAARLGGTRLIDNVILGEEGA